MISKSKPAFTFIEIVIAMAILGILFGVAIPSFIPKTTSYERDKFITSLNALTQVAWQNALVQQKLHRIVFDLTQRKAFIEICKDDKARSEDNFEPVSLVYVSDFISWPNEFEFKNFYIGQQDDLHSGIGTKAKVWFFIVPSGLAQNVIINIVIVKNERLEEDNQDQFSLVLNPFSAQFKEYETLQSPA